MTLEFGDFRIETILGFGMILGFGTIMGFGMILGFGTIMGFGMILGFGTCIWDKYYLGIWDFSN